MLEHSLLSLSNCSVGGRNSQHMQNALFDNRVLMAAFVAWVIAQVSKTVYELFRQKKLIISRLVSAGGMPSSHSALVTGLATATGRLEGIGSTAFAISVVLAGIVMYDAVSLQARILNQMLDEVFQGHPIAEQRLRELIGHTPIQVLVGGLLGVVVGILLTI
jgi:acid phosphatase family membrane protein YuiD